MTQHVLSEQTTDDGAGLAPGSALGMRGDPAPAVTEAAGRAFAGLFRLVKLARPDRPIHPDGLGLSGELVRTGSGHEPSGVDWLDAPGLDTVQARFSRSAGLPQSLPDVLGLALRLTPNPGSSSSGHAATGSPADILFSSTGWRVPGRFLLQPKLDVASATLTTLMPYRGPKGPVLLGVRTMELREGSLATGEWVLGLYWARPAGRGASAASSASMPAPARATRPSASTRSRTSPRGCRPTGGAGACGSAPTWRRSARPQPPSYPPPQRTTPRPALPAQRQQKGRPWQLCPRCSTAPPQTSGG
ncbi:hypothetical protein FDW81_05060 [Pseudarthrobacter sp. NamB4]|nr:hypothetical protein FDW81_05060 [Pseudarthrobacter sp. NamB4]